MLPVINFRYKNQVFALVLIVTAYFVTGNSLAVEKVYVGQNKCMKESYEFLALVKSEQAESKILARDPYVPFDSSVPDLTRQFWGLTFKDVESSKAQLIGTNSGFASRYLSPAPEWFSADKKEGWSDKTEFYEKFTKQSEVVTPSGKVFTKIYENICGQSLWKLK